MILSITKYKPKEKLNIQDYTKWNSSTMKYILDAIDDLLGSSNSIVYTGVPHEV